MLVLSPVQNIVSGSSAAIARPTFSRDFAGEKTLNNGTGPAITFTRASNATFFDANGTLQTAANDTPRFDHDPATGASRGLLVEESRTNLFERSAELDNAYWAKTNATVSVNQTTAPDGTTSAETLVETVANGGHHVSRVAVSFTSGVSYTASVFIKQFSGSRNFRIGFPTAAFPVSSRSAVFNPSNGSVVQQDAGVTASVQTVGTFYRVSLTATANATASESLFFNLYDNQTASYTGDGTSGLYIWGAQLEAGAFPTSYIPTTTAAATRAADSAVVTPISSFYNQAEGTLFAEANIPSSPSNAFAADVYTDVQNRLGIYRAASSTDMASFVMVGNSGQSGLVNTVTTQPTKSALAFASDNFAMATNGGTVAVDTSGSLPSATSLRIGQRADGGQAANGHIRKIAYWPKRLSDTLLQQITT